MSAFDADVVIVGAGPIGLAHAWGIKRINPDIRVTVLEKYPEYQRKHTLIMQHKQLLKLMEATGAGDDEDIQQLYQRLQHDAHIRTSELELTFKGKAEELGVNIINEEVQADTFKQQTIRRFPNLKLLIGADGTRSVVNRVCFGQENYIRHEFDHVLQLRLELIGDGAANSLPSSELYQHLVRHGMVATEYVGAYNEETGKTPVTLQVIITREQFESLKDAKSKDPIYPFVEPHAHTSDDDDYADDDGSDDEEETLHRTIPQELNKFINEYLASRDNSHGHKVDEQSVRISVNETPAQQARRVALKSSGRVTRFGVLVGDAGLGLSYFKGLNAGLESSAKLLSSLQPALTEGLENPQTLESGLSDYQSWFTGFAQRKVKEVHSYSLWRVRSGVNGLKLARKSKLGNATTPNSNLQSAMEDLFFYRSLDPVNEAEYRLFPHRRYPLVKLGQLPRVPLHYTWKKTTKIFRDSIKPYKASYQVLRDFQQPLWGIVNIASGLYKVLSGSFALNGGRCADGGARIFRGATELLTTPFAWTIKPLVRGIASLIAGSRNIEDNPGMHALATQGREQLTAIEEAEISLQQLHALRALCNDLHRKYTKNATRGQDSSIREEEAERFSLIRQNKQFTPELLNGYFSLFQKKDNAIDEQSLLIAEPPQS